MRRSKRDELSRRMAAWWEDTTPQQRGPLIAGIVTVGLLIPSVMITTFVILVVRVTRVTRGNWRASRVPGVARPP